MDLSPIGEHCSLQTCNVLDFLPIRCACLQWFCKSHISPDLHDCPSLRLLQQYPSRSSSTSRERSKCTFVGCNKPSLVTSVPVTREEDEAQTGCPGCQLAFCVEYVPDDVHITRCETFDMAPSHRHMQSHSCTGLTIENVGMKRVVLAQKFPETSTLSLTSHTPVVARRPSNLPSDSKKLAHLQRVNLMRLRHQAVAGDPKDRGSIIPVDQRIHVTVRLEITGQSTKEVALWFRKTMITGKALDLVVHHFDVSRTACTLRLRLSSPEIAGHVLQNDLQLSGQLEDGATVVLTDSQSND